jgi:hypothetical protein
LRWRKSIVELSKPEVPLLCGVIEIMMSVHRSLLCSPDWLLPALPVLTYVNGVADCRT